MPTEPRIINFHPASSASLLRSKAISSAAARVEPSIAIHIMATSATLTAISIAARKRSKRQKNRRNRLSGRSPRSNCSSRYPTANRVPVVPTTASTRSSHALSASVYSSRPTVIGSPVPTPATTWAPAASRITACPYCSASTTRRSCIMRVPKPARMGAMTSSTRVHIMAGLLLQHRQLARIHAVERILDPVGIDPDDEDCHEHVEEDSQLHDQRHAMRSHRGAQKKSVLHHKKADHLGDRFLAGDHGEKPDQHDGQRDRQGIPRQQKPQRNDGLCDEEGQDDEGTTDQQPGWDIDI